MRTAPFVWSLALALAACASSVATHSETKPGANFAGLRTFAWVPTRLSAEAGGDLKSVIDSIEGLAVAELRAKGFVPAEGATPDFQITGWVSVAQKESVAYVDNGFGGFGSSGGTVAPMTEVRSAYEEGTLVLDVVEGKTGAAMWRGTATGTVERDRPEADRRARLQEAVHATLADFPPK
jgi:hypothetical protein